MNKRPIRHALTLLVATAALSAGVGSAAAATVEQQPFLPATQTESQTGDIGPRTVNIAITAPERLTVDHCYQTPKACLVFQHDGNLVVYDEYGVARWNSGTWGHTNAYADFQTDGNLVVYSHTGIALWNSGTWANPGATLWVQHDGNVVIYTKTGTPVWATHSEH